MPEAALTRLPMVFSDMPVVLTVPAAPPELDRSKLRYWGKLKTPIFPGATIFDETTLFASEKPDGTGADFYVSNILRNLKKITPLPPDPNATGIFWANQTIEFVLEYAYYVDGVISGTWQTLTPSQYTFKGGLSFDDWVGWGNKFFTDYLTSTRQFLTWQPNNKYVDERQKEYLYYLVNFTPLPTKLQLWCMATYEDGSTELIKAAEIGPVGQYRVYGMAVGYRALGLHLKTKRTHSYQVYLTNQNGDTLSEVRSYIVDDIYYENPYYFLFRNSIGGYDTMRFTGEIEESLKSERQTASRFLTNQVGRDFRENYEISVASQREISIATGFLSEGPWLDYLQELERSPEAYRLTETGMIPLLNSGNQLLYYKKTEKLQAANFKFRYAPTEAFYSVISDAQDAIIPPPVDDDDDTPPQTEFNLTVLIDVTSRTPADGDSYTVSVALLNNEPVPITTAILLVVLPTGISFVSSADPRVASDDPNVTITFPSVAPGDVALATFVADITGSVGATLIIPVEIDSIANGTAIGTTTASVSLTISDGSEPPVLEGWTDTPRHTFTPTTTRGVYNPANIPQFAAPATKKLIWMGAGRNYFTATSDDVFDYGFTHLVQNCMVDGVEYYSNIGAIPPGYVSPIPPEKRVLVMGGSYYTQDAFGLLWANDYNQYAAAYFENVSGKPNHPDNSAYNAIWRNLGGAISEIGGFGALYNESAFPYAIVLDDVENDGDGDESFWQEHVNLKLHQLRKLKLVMGSGTLLLCHDTRAFNCYSDPKASHYSSDPNHAMWDAQAKLTSSSTGRGMPVDNHNRIVRDQPDRNHAGNYYYDWELLPEGTYNTTAYAQSQGYPTTLTLNHQTGVNWLCNLLANQEVNDIRSPKKRIAWVWLFNNDGFVHLKKRYPRLDSGYIEADNSYPDIPLTPEMAEGSAVWLFFTGAEGLVLWDNVANLGGTAQSPVTISNTYNSSYTGQAIDRLYAVYEHYLHGLWRLFNHHADMFDGTETYLNQNTDLSFDGGTSWHKYNAVQLKELGLPFARAIVKGNQILVCAQKPYADDAYTEAFLIRYNTGGYNFQATITLTGKGVWLKRATMPLA